jgi:hypothetical protein
MKLIRVLAFQEKEEIVNIYIKKDIQAKDNNAYEMVSNVCSLLVQIIVWLGMASKVQITRKGLRGTKRG